MQSLDSIGVSCKSMIADGLLGNRNVPAIFVASLPLSFLLLFFFSSFKFIKRRGTSMPSIFRGGRGFVCVRYEILTGFGGLTGKQGVGDRV